MKKSQHRQSRAVAYELAATSRSKSVRIYGQSLEEVCLRHKDAIKRTASYDLRAIEQGKYATFMLSQIQNFSPGRRKEVLRHIIVLLETAIDTLSGLENHKKSKYRHITHNLRQQLETALRLA